jgi:hypothetical protein
VQACLSIECTAPRHYLITVNIHALQVSLTRTRKCISPMQYTPIVKAHDITRPEPKLQLKLGLIGHAMKQS